MNEDHEARERFLITLDWLLALNERYDNAVRYGLLHVCFHDRQVLGDVYGAQHAVNLLTGLAARLRKAFRKTDLVARDGTEFWILIPYTEPQTVIDKVTQLVDLASQSGLDVVERDLAFFTLGGANDVPMPKSSRPLTALQYLDELRKHRLITHRWSTLTLPRQNSG
jgi:GGDEF domain-containing protein